jgi:hypothetical protein
MVQAAARGFTACVPTNISNNIGQEPPRGRPVEMNDEMRNLIGEILHLNYCPVGVKGDYDINNNLDQYSSTSKNANKKKRVQEEVVDSAAIYSLRFINTVNSDDTGDRKEGLLARLGLSFHPLDSSFMNPSPALVPTATTYSSSSSLSSSVDPGVRASFPPSFDMNNGLPVVQLLLVDAGK